MARGRWIVIPLFVALLVGAVMLAGRIGDVTTDEQTLPGSEAARGIELVQTRFSDGREATDIQPVFRNPSLTVDDPAYRAEVTAALKRGAGVVPGTRVVSYFTTGSRDLVGQDGHMTFATLSVPLPEQQATKHIDAIRDAIGTPDGFSPTLVGGDAAVWHDLEPQLNDDLARAEMIVLPVALLVLLIFFGSAVSALLPVLLAGVSIVFAFAGTYLAGQAMDIADLVTNVITLVGIAIGIDYALLVVSRFREEMRNGADRVDATGRTMATAGRAVLLSGVTVAIGLAVLVALPVPFIRSMGIGGMLVPVSAVLTALTALPAVLAVLGPRVDALRVYPRRWRLREAALWGPIARAVTGWAIPLAAVALVALVALAGQATNMSIDQDELADAPKVESVQAGRLVRAELGGTLNPDIYVIDTGRPDGAYDPATIAALGKVADGFRAQPDIVSGVTWPSATDPEAFRAAAEGGLVDAHRAVRPDAGRPARRPALRLGARAQRPDGAPQGGGLRRGARRNGPAHRRAGGPERVQRGHVRAVPVAGRGRPRADLRRAHARVPLVAGPADRGARVRALAARDLRPAVPRVPAGHRRRTSWASTARSAGSPCGCR